MLTFSPNAKPQRKDRPWLLFLLVIIWIGGACFFHAPWEPYEPFVVAVVKSIIATNKWLIPRIATGAPYLDLQPFYFWIYALIIKIFNFSDIVNAVRLINSVLILLFIAIMGRIGSRLSAFKNGRTVIMILISSVGFISNAYQLSPNLIVLLGFSLYFFALQSLDKQPGISAWLLSLGLILISLNFTGEFILIAVMLLFMLPLIDRRWNNSRYFFTAIAGLLLFSFIFISYVWQLKRENYNFFVQWHNQYTDFMVFEPKKWLGNGAFFMQTLAWYVIPSWILLLWSFYKRRRRIFADKIIRASILFALLIFVFAVLSGVHHESVLFPILIPFVLIGSLEIDSIRITIVSLLNWFCLFVFGAAGVFLFLLYVALNFGHPIDLLTRANYYAPEYIFNFNFWQLSLAIISAAIWIFMITRRHIRGREMLSNWASGTTFVLAMFVSLCLPWFNAVLSFKGLVESSEPYLKTGAYDCIASVSSNHIENALWYYYADVRFTPSHKIEETHCNQMLVADNMQHDLDYLGWKIVWSDKRPVDTRRYVLLERINNTK